MKTALPTDAQERKETPVVRGVLDYFPAAIAEVARVSKKGNDQHNPGQEMHWARGKSSDHADCIVRHLMDRGTLDSDGLRHSAKVAWRALALLQEELEAAGAAPGRASQFPAQEAEAKQAGTPFNFGAAMDMIEEARRKAVGNVYEPVIVPHRPEWERT